MPEEEVRITLRLPAEVRDRVADAGKASGRSLNSEIVHRLEMSFSMTEAEISIKAERSAMMEAIERQEEVYRSIKDLLASKQLSPGQD